MLRAERDGGEKGELYYKSRERMAVWGKTAAALIAVYVAGERETRDVVEWHARTQEGVFLGSGLEGTSMLLTPVEPKFWGGAFAFPARDIPLSEPRVFYLLAQSYTRSVIIKMAESSGIHIVPCQKYSRFAFSLSTGTTLHFGGGHRYL